MKSKDDNDDKCVCVCVCVEVRYGGLGAMAVGWSGKRKLYACGRNRQSLWMTGTTTESFLICCSTEIEFQRSVDRQR